MTESSQEALDFSLPLAPAARWHILTAIHAMHRATCSDIEDRLKSKHQAVSARLDELTLMGLVSPDFGKRERPNLPSESVYGLTPAALRILSNKDFAYAMVTRIGAVRNEKAAERAEALRALKEDWRSHIADACRAEIDRICPSTSPEVS